jgi:hypothetical protein
MRTRAEWFGLLSLHNWYTAQHAFDAFNLTWSTKNLSIEQRIEKLSEPCATMKVAVFEGINLNDAAVKKLRTGLGVIAYDQTWKQFES